MSTSYHYWCGTFQFTSILTPGPHDTLWARHNRDWRLYFVGRNKGSEEANSSAQSDTVDKCKKWGLNLHLSTPGSSGAFPHILLSCSVSLHQTVLSMVSRFDDREALFYLKHFSSFRKEKNKKSLLVLMKQSLLSLNNFWSCWWNLGTSDLKA